MPASIIFVGSILLVCLFALMGPALAKAGAEPEGEWAEAFDEWLSREVPPDAWAEGATELEWAWPS